MKKTLSVLTIVLLLLIPINTLGVNIDTTPIQNLTSNDPDGDTNYDIYEKLLNWTNEWCKGLKNDKEIVDAIFDGFVESEILKYGKNPNEHTTEEILDEPFEDGCYYAMCDGISQVFQDACAVQGIDIYKFWYLQKNNERNIKGIICLSPGLGRNWDEEFFAETEVGPWLFIDEETSYRYPPSFSDYNKEKTYVYYDDENPFPNIDDDVNYVIQGQLQVYCFRPPDGHSVNLYKDENGVHLYDLSFETQVDNVFEELPLELDEKNDVEGYFSSEDWNCFREKYHDKSVDYFIEEIVYTNGKKTESKDFHIKADLYDETWPSPYKIKLFPPEVPPICKISIHCYKDENENEIQDEGEKDAAGMYVYIQRYLVTPFFSSFTKTTDLSGDVNFFIKTHPSYCFEVTCADRCFRVFEIKWLEFYYIYRHEIEEGKRKFNIGLKKASWDGSVVGEISNQKNDELNATVTCKGIDNTYNLTKNTRIWPSGKNYFLFNDLTVPGTYEITIEKEGYKTWKDTVHLDDTLGGDLKWYYNIVLISDSNSKSKNIHNFYLLEKLYVKFNFILDIIQDISDFY